MKISGNDDILKYINDATVTRSEEKTSSAQVNSQEQEREHTDNAVVNISQRSKEVQLAQQAMASEPEIRFDKVQDITEKVQNGTYEINYDKTSEKMVSTFIDELV